MGHCFSHNSCHLNGRELAGQYALQASSRRSSNLALVVLQIILDLSVCCAFDLQCQDGSCLDCRGSLLSLTL